jgi:hypothetical protein
MSLVRIDAVFTMKHVQTEMFYLMLAQVTRDSH